MQATGRAIRARRQLRASLVALGAAVLGGNSLAQVAEASGHEGRGDGGARGVSASAPWGSGFFRVSNALGRSLYPADPYPYPTDPYPTDPYPTDSDAGADALVQDVAFSLSFPGATCDAVNFDELLSALIASWQVYGMSVDPDNASITLVTCPDGTTFVPSSAPTLTRRLMREVGVARRALEDGSSTLVEFLVVGLPEDEVTLLIGDLGGDDPQELSTLFDLCTGCDTESDPTLPCAYTPGDGLFTCFTTSGVGSPSVEGPLETSLVYDPIVDGPSGGGPTTPIPSADVSGDPHITGFDGSKFDLFAPASGAHVTFLDIPDSVSIRGTLSVTPEMRDGGTVGGVAGEGLTMTYVDTLQATILGGSELRVQTDGSVTVNDKVLPAESSVTLERGAATVAHSHKDVHVVDDLAGGGYEGEGCSSVGVRIDGGAVAFTVDVMRNSHLNLRVDWGGATNATVREDAARAGGILGATAPAVGEFNAVPIA